MAIPEELKGTVFSYCRETEDQDTLPAMTAAWDAAEAYLLKAPVTASGWESFCLLHWMPTTRERPRPSRESWRKTRPSAISSTN